MINIAIWFFLLIGVFIQLFFAVRDYSKPKEYQLNFGPIQSNQEIVFATKDGAEMFYGPNGIILPDDTELYIEMSTRSSDDWLMHWRTMLVIGGGWRYRIRLTKK